MKHQNADFAGFRAMVCNRKEQREMQEKIKPHNLSRLWGFRREVKTGRLVVHREASQDRYMASDCCMRRNVRWC